MMNDKIEYFLLNIIGFLLLGIGVYFIAIDFLSFLRISSCVIFIVVGIALLSREEE